MEEPELYATSNSFQVRDAEVALSSYGHRMAPLGDEDRVLDIGCGVGNITRNILLPICYRASTLVGVDISASMVEYAGTHFPHRSLLYQQMDISQKCGKFQKAWGSFARIYSFYCLHWIKDQQNALRNIASLLSTNGECLLLFVAQCPVYELYKRMANSPKWKPYMMDVDQFIPNTHNSINPAAEFSQKMKSAGLEVLACDVRQTSFTFDNIQQLQDSFRAISPFYGRIPDEDKAYYLKDCLLSLASSNRTNANSNNCFNFQYKLLIAHGRRVPIINH